MPPMGPRSHTSTSSKHTRHVGLWWMLLTSEYSNPQYQFPWLLHSFLNKYVHRSVLSGYLVPTCKDESDLKFGWGLQAHIPIWARGYTGWSPGHGSTGSTILGYSSCTELSMRMVPKPMPKRQALHLSQWGPLQNGVALFSRFLALSLICWCVLDCAPTELHWIWAILHGVDP